MNLLVPVTWIGAYLLGAIPFGYLIAKSRGVDIFAAGSGNIGATNVGRVLGRKFGLLVFLLDLGKGAVAVLLALAVKQSAPADDTLMQSGWLEVGAGLASFIGHMFPVYLGFRGGKGVATGAGVMLILCPGPALAALFTWLVIVACTRYVSLASLAGAAVLTAVQLSTLQHSPLELSARQPAEILQPRSVFCLLALVLVFVRHRSNVVRLLRGNENQIKDSATMLQFTKILHVYAMGLWFGMALFFTFPVTLSLFGTFNELGDLPAKQRPAWFPVADAFSHTHKDALGPGKDLIGPREQGSRAFAVAVSPLFTWYFLLSGICGLVAVLTALTWSRKFPQFRVHQLRASILFAALITVLIGWPLERKVSELREPRNQATLAYLDSESPTEAQHKEMMEARAEFGMWHTLSLFLNFATVLLVVVGMAMTTDLPTANEASDGRAGMATPPAADRNFGTLKP